MKTLQGNSMCRRLRSLKTCARTACAYYCWHVEKARCKRKITEESIPTIERKKKPKSCPWPCTKPCLKTSTTSGTLQDISLFPRLKRELDCKESKRMNIKNLSDKGNEKMCGREMDRKDQHSNKSTRKRMG